MLERWKQVSLRTQLVAIICVLVACTLALTGALFITLLRTELVSRTDQNLYANAGGMSQALIQNPQRGFSFGTYYGQLVLPTGQVARSTGEVSNDSPSLKGLDVRSAARGPNVAYDLPGTADGSPGWRVHIYDSPYGTVVIGSSYKDIHQTVDATTARTLLLGLLATATASAIAWLAVTRAFKPLSKVEKTAAAIAAGDLSKRVEVDNPATEIGRLSSSLNAMLAHIETAFASKAASEKRMRRFVADASHELRTPLVTIRGFSELYRHGALQSEDQVKAAMGRIEGEAQRMSQLVEDLLTLARVDEQRPMESRPLDLLLLGNDAAMDARASDPERQISVIGLDGGIPRPAPVVGDEGRLRQVMANLVTNALRYTPAGSPIEIAVGVEPVIDDRKDSVIEVRDHGPGISDDEASRVFERFYRADSSRYRETGGTGLGLAIVAALVAQHDGTVRLSETEGGGATMSIRLPYEPLPEETDRIYEID
ncbi:phosphate regulon sensor protein [Arthrobacter crystallopoietes BAB-32]|uniref:histidine kinase n=1 Tax=Arthrobacter crystallopoietes BAB-32 TaxID=1246476 RepID=N1VA79_9MICC|nr:HAMP domain-containing sensor histidine kinase [Arthrobacter crystallopoietes]EMY35193.1 phosphate regulon sensor protein [Arthrobacter crystallopoietes BAB-32]